MSRAIRLALLLLSTAVAALVVKADVDAGVRSMVVLGFMFIVPGMAYVQLLNIGHPLIEMSLAIVLSIVINTTVAEIMLYTGTWSSQGGFVAVLAVCILGIALQILQLRTNSQGRAGREVKP